MTKFTFLERYNLSGKGFIPFCTNESSGVGVTISSQSGWRMPALTAAEDELLATTPAEELLGLDTDPNLLLRFLKDLNRNIKATGPMFFLGEAPETGCSDVKK